MELRFRHLLTPDEPCDLVHEPQYIIQYLMPQVIPDVIDDWRTCELYR